MLTTILLQATSTSFDTVLNSLLASGPIAVVLFFFISKLWQKLETKDEQIEELHKELRDIEKGTTEAMNRLTASVISLGELIKTITSHR